MYRAKIRNAKHLQWIQDMRVEIQKSTEDCEIPPKEEMVQIAGEMENRTPEDKTRKRPNKTLLDPHNTSARGSSCGGQHPS